MHQNRTFWSFCSILKNHFPHDLLQDSSVVRYHLIPGVLLFPDLLWDGMTKSTALGADYQVQFHLNSRNQVKRLSPAWMNSG